MPKSDKNPLEKSSRPSRYALRRLWLIWVLPVFLLFSMLTNNDVDAAPLRMDISRAIAVVAEYSLEDSSLANDLIFRTGFSHGLHPEIWNELPIIHKLEMAYRAAERGGADNNEGGTRFLALLARQLAQLYDSAYHESSLQAYLAYHEPFPPIQFKRSVSARPSLHTRLPQDVRAAISTISEYISGSHGIFAVLTAHNGFRMTPEGAYDILASETSCKAALKTAIKLHGVDERLRILEQITETLRGQYEAARFEINLDPFDVKQRELSHLIGAVFERRIDLEQFMSMVPAMSGTSSQLRRLRRSEDFAAVTARILSRDPAARSRFVEALIDPPYTSDRLSKNASLIYVVGKNLIGEDAIRAVWRRQDLRRPIVEPDPQTMMRAQIDEQRSKVERAFARLGETLKAWDRYPDSQSAYDECLDAAVDAVIFANALAAMDSSAHREEFARFRGSGQSTIRAELADLLALEPYDDGKRPLQKILENAGLNPSEVRSLNARAASASRHNEHVPGAKQKRSSSKPHKGPRFFPF